MENEEKRDEGKCRLLRDREKKGEKGRQEISLALKNHFDLMRPLPEFLPASEVLFHRSPD